MSPRGKIGWRPRSSSIDRWLAEKAVSERPRSRSTAAHRSTQPSQIYTRLPPRTRVSVLLPTRYFTSELARRQKEQIGAPPLVPAMATGRVTRRAPAPPWLAAARLHAYGGCSTGSPHVAHALTARIYSFCSGRA